MPSLEEESKEASIEILGFNKAKVSKILKYIEKVDSSLQEVIEYKIRLKSLFKDKYIIHKDMKRRQVKEILPYWESFTAYMSVKYDDLTFEIKKNSKEVT